MTLTPATRIYSPNMYTLDRCTKAAKFFRRLLVRNRIKVRPEVLADIELLAKGHRRAYALREAAYTRLSDFSVAYKRDTIVKCAAVGITSNYTRYFIAKATEMAFAKACSMGRGKTELKCQRRDLLEICF